MHNSSTSRAVHKPTALDNFISRKEFCEQYDIAYRTAEMWVHKGQGPRVTRIGRKAFYCLDDIAAWLEAQRQKSASRFGKGAKP